MMSSTPSSYASTWAPTLMNNQKKMSRKELYTHIRSLTAVMDKEEKEKFTTKLKKRVFNSERRFDIDLSCLRHLLCKHRKDYVKFDISSYFDKSR